MGANLRQLALCALALLLVHGAAARSLKTYNYKPVKHDKHHGDICQFKADKDYSTKAFAKAFSLHWDDILKLNKEWCGDHHITHVPNGSLWDVPCDCHHPAKGSNWHWKTESWVLHQGHASRALMSPRAHKSWKRSCRSMRAGWHQA